MMEMETSCRTSARSSAVVTSETVGSQHLSKHHPSVRCRMHLPKSSAKSEVVLDFTPVTHDAMSEIWGILSQEYGRTTDFSYGGLLMWVGYFRYEYCIVEETLFIKGRVESDRRRTAFSLPVGRLPLAESLELLRGYCRRHGYEPIMSAVPEYALPELEEAGIQSSEELADWADYLYDAGTLATLKGKKMGKKRNHVNQFLSASPEWSLEPLDSQNVAEAVSFMDVFELEGDDTPEACAERELTRGLLEVVRSGDQLLEGALLKSGGKVCAFTVGDVKGDTLFIHIEKATRQVPGSYEMINREFAASMLSKYPEIRFINREDDAGDPGLRAAKESYHPVDRLRKFNVRF